MATTTQTTARLRPRVLDVTDALYENVRAYVERTETTAYFERKGGETVLVAR